MSLLTAIALASFAPAFSSADDAKKAVESLQGEWRYLTFTKLKRDNPEVVKNGKVVIKGDEITFNLGDDNTTVSFTLDPKAEPPAIDWKVGGMTVIMGIYKLDKDKLTICFGIEGSARPTEFKTGKNNSIMVLERVKK